MRRRWRPELAYAVGVLLTDGYVSTDGRHIAVVSLMSSYSKS
jgi:hypothetical protein